MVKQSLILQMMTGHHQTYKKLYYDGLCNKLLQANFITWLIA
jgi:hypothetical protein